MKIKEISHKSRETKETLQVEANLKSKLIHVPNLKSNTNYKSKPKPIIELAFTQIKITMQVYHFVA